MVPLLNFTTNKYKSSESKPNNIQSMIWYFITNILFPISYKKLKKDENFSSFLQTIQNIEYKSLFFKIPAMEAVMASRWRPTKFYWRISFTLYFFYLGLFSYLSWFYLGEKRSIGKATEVINILIMILFYYIGIYLLVIEVKQMIEYKITYFTGYKPREQHKRFKYNFSKLLINLFNLLDVFSIVFGIITLTIILINSYTQSNLINNEALVVLSSFTVLILWIQVVTF